MGLYELFELCANSAQPPAEAGSSQAAPTPGFEVEDFQQLKAQLFRPSLVAVALMCLALLQGFAAS